VITSCWMEVKKTSLRKSDIGNRNNSPEVPIEGEFVLEIGRIARRCSALQDPQRASVTERPISLERRVLINKKKKKGFASTESVCVPQKRSCALCRRHAARPV
jgi:hypothetical protein